MTAPIASQKLGQHRLTPGAQRLFDRIGVEAEAHRLLAGDRVNPRREFFRATVAQAVLAVNLASLMTAWNKAGAEARSRFLARVGAA